MKHAEQGVALVGEILKAAGDNPNAKEAGNNLGKSALTITETINNALLPLAANPEINGVHAQQIPELVNFANASLLYFSHLVIDPLLEHNPSDNPLAQFIAEWQLKIQNARFNMVSHGAINDLSVEQPRQLLHID